MRRAYRSRLILVGWLFAALSLLIFFLASLAPGWAMLPLLMLLAAASVPLVMEFAFKGLFLQVLATTLLALIRFPLGMVAPYALFLCYYAPLKYFCERGERITGWLSKLILCCVAFGALMLLFPDPLFAAYAAWPAWADVLLMVALFMLLDVVVTLFSAWYNSVLRKRLF